MIRESSGENGCQVMCETQQDFEDWCISCGWNNSKEFTKDVGVRFEDVEGEFFELVGGRIYIVEPEKLWIEEYKDGV